MKKLLVFLDNYLLKIGVCLLLAFIALYPKLPSILVTHTWVYIRLEDFFISIVVGIWLVQLLRKKVSLPFSLGLPIVGYWVIGLISLTISILFIGPHLANYFPKIAALEYVRRIEYMILFFVGFSSIRTKKDIRDYLIILGITIFGVILYGFGQRFYLSVWAAFPDFARRVTFCFPSFQTGNEEFAKGIPLCLPSDARITSTFGGHYDLAAYLVVVIPVFIGLCVAIKNIWIKILTGVLSLLSVMLLVFTASRISFVAYLLGTCAMFIFLKKKKYIIPVFFISVVLLVVFSNSLAKRFLETIRLTSIVTNNQGQVIGVAPSTLPADLQKKIAENPAILENIPTQNLPAGTSYTPLTLAQTPVSTSVAVVKTSLTQAQIKALKLKNGGVEISTVSGNFLVQKALVYDISLTTRFQAEWPNAWNAFLRDPPFGSGYSSITLASDNDYIRALGESGFLGFISFLFIFLFFGISVKQIAPSITNNVGKSVIFGLSGGVIGLFINASLIDVFEASKVAEPLWLLLGIGSGALFLYKKGNVSYLKDVKKVLFSPILIAIYFLCLTFMIYGRSINNFFVGDDFTWLHWAANSTADSFKNYFLDSTGFFYRPLAKIAMLFLYTFFSFTPQGYHVFNIVLDFLMAFGVYLLSQLTIRKKYLSFFAGILFLILPGRTENFFWISTMSITLSCVFILYSFIFFIHFRKSSSKISYICSCLLAVLGLFTYEGAIIYPFILLSYDFLMRKSDSFKKVLLSYVPFMVGLLGYVGIREYSNALGPNGDYSYSLVHFIPNFFGNLLGYILLFLFGEQSLSWYSTLRTDLKSWSLSLIVIFAIALFIAIYKFFRKKTFLKLYKQESTKVYLFFGLFVVIALLPFLGFGNITLRYGYLASVGFSCLIIYALFSCLEKILSEKSHIKSYTVMTIIVFLFGIFGFSQVIVSNADWNKAGQITNKTLAYIKIYDDDVVPGSSFFFSNIPIKYHNAWVFPVGIEDGLWFIYRDPTLHVYKVSSAQEAVQDSMLHPKTSYVFSFDSNGNFKEIDHHTL